MDGRAGLSGAGNVSPRAARDHIERGQTVPRGLPHTTPRSPWVRLIPKFASVAGRAGHIPAPALRNHAPVPAGCRSRHLP